MMGRQFPAQKENKCREPETLNMQTLRAKTRPTLEIEKKELRTRAQNDRRKQVNDGRRTRNAKIRTFFIGLIQ